ncbi:MAG: hypothetical protein U9N52_04560 [Campylobacterota bacterium]|nr:hypothetical protein [Campylobacterota bacterium]
MKENIEKLSLCIERESKHFLTESMNLELLNSQEIAAPPLTPHIALIDLANSKKFTILIAIKESLFKALFDCFFPDGVPRDEQAELDDALPDEIINTIVGLSIQCFPSEYADLELSIPYKLREDVISRMLQQSIFKSLEIVTCKGSFYCVILSIEE